MPLFVSSRSAVKRQFRKPFGPVQSQYVFAESILVVLLLTLCMSDGIRPTVNIYYKYPRGMREQA